MTVTSYSYCRSCKSDDITLLLDYGNMPLAGSFLLPEESHLDRSYPLRLARCNQCTLMQVLDSVNADVIFGRYSYASSTTRTLTTHFAHMGEELVRLADAKGRLVVEFGCNDGVLIRPLQNAGASAVGVDPSDVARQASEEQGWPLINDYFTESVASEIKRRYGTAKVIVGNNVFAHVDDIHSILRAVTDLLSDDGFFVVEVHYQGDLIDLVQFDTVYHEHIFYYSLTSLKWLFASHGLKIVDVKRIPIHAGSIRVVASREESLHAASSAVDYMLREEQLWNVTQFVEKAEVRRETIYQLTRDLTQAGKRVIAYGAAGRATVLLNYCRLGKDIVEYVVDMSPLRYGRLVPGVLVPIVTPNEFHVAAPDYAIVTAWNYLTEIVEKEQNFLKGGGRFIVPLPNVTIAGMA